jgi:hypothetical protein
MGRVSWPWPDDTFHSDENTHEDDSCSECRELQKRIEDLEMQLDMIISDYNIDRRDYRFFH